MRSAWISFNLISNFLSYSFIFSYPHRTALFRTNSTQYEKVRDKEYWSLLIVGYSFKIKRAEGVAKRVAAAREIGRKTKKTKKNNVEQLKVAVSIIVCEYVEWRTDLYVWHESGCYPDMTCIMA